MLNFVIEGLLMENDMSGYDINLYLKDVPVLKAGYGNIYPALKKLEASGSIISKEIVEAGKYKKIYTINEKGKKEFLEWLEKPVKINKSKDECLIRLYFFQFLSIDKVKSQITDFIRQFKTAKRSMEIMHSLTKKNSPYSQAALLQYYIDLLQFNSNWYQKLLNDLEEQTNSKSRKKK